MTTILVVNSDSSARRQLSRQLKEFDHSIVDSPDAATALIAMRKLNPDLVLCGMQLSDRSGIDLLGQIRSDDTLRSIRVLVIADSADALRAVEAGADDFIRKPVDETELAARVAACLRREPLLVQAESITSGGITIDNVSKRLMVDKRFVSVAPREYRLLYFFLKNQERVFTREQLLANVWDQDVSVGARTVDVHIRRLRSVLEPAGYDRYLQTVRGSGYRYSLSS